MDASDTRRAGLYSARPRLVVDGQEDVELGSRLLDFSAHAGFDGQASLQLRLGNWSGSDFAQSPGRRPTLGSRLLVRVDDATLFEGRVSSIGLELGLHQAPVFTVCAEDALAGARAQRRTRLHAQQDLQGLLSAVAQQQGLIPDPQLPASEARDWLQANESDLAFLRRVLGEAGCALLLDGQRLWAGPAPQRAAASIALVNGQNLHSLQAVADLAHQCTAVSVAGWDARQGQALQARSSGREPGLNSGGLRGDQALQQTLGERVEHLAAQAVHSQGQAQLLADAAFDQRCRRFVQWRAVCEIEPAAQPGSSVELRACGAYFDGVYQLQARTHRFDAQLGLRTELQAGGPCLPGGI